METGRRRKGTAGDILSWSIPENFERPYVTMTPRTARQLSAHLPSLSLERGRGGVGK